MKEIVNLPPTAESEPVVAFGRTASEIMRCYLASAVNMIEHGDLVEWDDPGLGALPPKRRRPLPQIAAVNLDNMKRVDVEGSEIFASDLFKE